MGFFTLVLSLLISLSFNTSIVLAKDDGANSQTTVRAPQRTFRTFLPKAGETIDDPGSELVQILLDRQDKGDFESYMVQVLFRGKTAERSYRVLEDRIVIDFYDTGKPSMRLSKIRGGAIEASSLEELFYKDTSDKTPGTPAATGAGNGLIKHVSKGQSSSALRIKRLVRLTLFIHEKVGDLKFRDTLDRTLIHFRLPKAPGLKD